MSSEIHVCEHCEASLGIAGPLETQNDWDVQADHDQRVAWHDTGACIRPPSALPPVDLTAVAVEGRVLISVTPDMARRLAAAISTHNVGKAGKPDWVGDMIQLLTAEVEARAQAGTLPHPVVARLGVES